MAELTPVIKHRYFDANGAPLVGGKLYTYQAGTNTPKATYVDRAGVSANANPVELDANGEADIWLATGYYKFILKDADEVTQWTVDYITSFAGSGTTTILNGSGTPSAGLGNDGDFYIDTTNSLLYGPKTSGAWGSGASMVGPGVETGGSEGAFLVKDSATNYDTAWTDTTKIFWDKTNNRLGIGTAAPTTRLTISNNASTLPAAVTGSVVHIGGVDGANSRVTHDGFGAQAPNYLYRYAAGTAAAPTAAQLNSALGQITFYGYGTTGYSSTVAAAIRGYAAENWTDSAQGTYINFSTSPLLSTTAAERMRISPEGFIGIGVTDPMARLTVAAVAASVTVGSSEQVSLRSSRSDIVSGNMIGGISFRSNDTNLTAPGTVVSLIDTIAEATHTASVLTSGIAFQTTDTLTMAERVRITGTGNVGIGITAPTSLLHTAGQAVAKTAAYTGILHTVDNTSSTNSIAKIGLSIQSTGTWNGTSATNTGLVVNATGGTTNYAATFSGGNVGIGTTTPVASSLVDMTSTTQGMLPPRMTTAQRDAISGPATGLVVYNTTTSVLNFYNGSAWLDVGTGVANPYIVQSKSANYTALTTDDAIFTTGSSSFTITLYAANTQTKPLSIFHFGTGTITIARAGADTIVGDTSVILSTQYTSVQLVSDGTSAFGLL